MRVNLSACWPNKLKLIVVFYLLPLDNGEANTESCAQVKLLESKMFHTPETQKYFFMSHFYIIIDGKNSISFDNIIWNKTVVQTVFSYFHNLLKTANKQCEKLNMGRKY